MNETRCDILIVDDDITLALMLRTWLSKQGFGAESVSTAEAARRRLSEVAFRLVLCDMRLPDADGTELLEWMAAEGIATPVIIMTGYADIQNAVQCMKLGARDYVAKPVNPELLLQKIREALAAGEAADGETVRDAAQGSGRGSATISATGSGAGAANSAPAARTPARRSQPQMQRRNYIEGRSDAARKLYEHVRLVAPTNMSVLITGASGTGKEHIAQLIHSESKRSGRPFVAVDCGSVPRELAASEFFGHVKGSFTGAVGDKTGAFMAANGGTLFLDEIGNLSYETQVQLLRALQERRIRPVGSNREIDIDIRLVAATNEELEAAIARGTFRADLYHRINQFALRMPELQQMREDIPLYADFFLDEANRELGRQIVGFDAAASALLLRYDWPGNLRQLRNAVMSATLLATGRYITARNLPAELAGAPAPAPLRDRAGEEEQIRQALAAPGGGERAARSTSTTSNNVRRAGKEGAGTDHSHSRGPTRRQARPAARQREGAGTDHSLSRGPARRQGRRRPIEKHFGRHNALARDSGRPGIETGTELRPAWGRSTPPAHKIRGKIPHLRQSLHTHPDGTIRGNTLTDNALSFYVQCGTLLAPRLDRNRGEKPQTE